MQITWHGAHTIKITTKDAVIVFDPYEPKNAPTPFRAKADIVALSNPSDTTMSHLAGITGEHLTIDTPGEYSVRGTTLDAVGWHDKENNERILYRWEIEGLQCVLLGALDRELTDSELTHLNEVDVDVLILPVGGGTALNTKDALHIVSAIEPRMVIPVNYKLPKWKEKLDTADTFVEELGAKGSKPEKKINIRANRLPQDEMQTALLKP